MSSFVAATPSTADANADEPALDNAPFWPTIDPADFRAAERLRTDIIPPRLTHALTAAMADVNRQLAGFAVAQVEAGVDTHDAIPLTAAQLPGHYANLYRRAVYATAHADLLERYADYSATNDGDERAQGKQSAADDYRRAARWAVAEIEDRPHSTVDLI